MATVNQRDTRTEAVRCVLCQGGLSLRGGNLNNFRDHLETAHSAVFDLDFLVSIAFLETEERERIVETVYPRVKKYFEILRSAPDKAQLAIEKRLLEDLEENSGIDSKRRKVAGSKFASLNEEQEDENTERNVMIVTGEEESLPTENKEEESRDITEEETETEKVLESRCDICEKPMLRKSIRKHKQRVHQLYENTRTSLFSINHSLTEDITATDTTLEHQSDGDIQEKEPESKNIPGTISCELCLKLIQRKNLKRHMNTVHHDREDKEELVTLDIEDKEELVTLEEQKCRICYAKFSVLAKLKDHVKDVHDIDYDNLETCEAQDEIEVEDLTSEPNEAEGTVREYQCDKCEASYQVKDSLRRHKRKKH